MLCRTWALQIHHWLSCKLERTTRLILLPLEFFNSFPALIILGMVSLIIEHLLDSGLPIFYIWVIGINLEIPFVIWNSHVTLFESSSWLPINWENVHKFVHRSRKHEWLVSYWDVLYRLNLISMGCPLWNLNNFRLVDYWLSSFLCTFPFFNLNFVMNILTVFVLFFSEINKPMGVSFLTLLNRSYWKRICLF